MPAKLVRTSCPLPGVGLCPPWHKYAMELEVTLISPPRTLPIGKNIHRSYGAYKTRSPYWTALNRCGLPRYIQCRCTRVDAVIHCSSSRNANNLIGIDEIRVRDVIVGCQTPPVCTKTVCYPTQCISTNNYICSVTARADGLRLRMRASHI